MATHHGPHRRPPLSCRPDPELTAWVLRLRDEAGIPVNQTLCEALELYRLQAAPPGAARLRELAARIEATAHNHGKDEQQ